MSFPIGEVRVVEAPGKLPGFPQRDTIFVANLLAMFFGNEEETKTLSEEVGEVDSYGGRLVPIVDLLFGKGGNLLVLEREPEAELCRYFGEVLGLSMPELSILPHGEYLKADRISLEGNHPFLDYLSNHSAKWIDGFVTDGTLAALAWRSGKQTVSTMAGSREGNNKRLLHEFLVASGLPVVEAVLVSSAEGIAPALEQLQKSGFSSAVIKSAIGASGIGMEKVDSLDDYGDIAAKIPDHFFYEGACIVQGWLQPGELGVTRMRSPSVQLFLDDESVTEYDVTEQILSDASVHQGNESPPGWVAREPELQRELLRQGGIVGKWLHSRGYRGTASADFLVVDRDGGQDVYVCEINARVTGATYPSVLARHFIPDGSWLMRNLRFTEPLTGRELLDALEKSGDLYLPGQSETGIIPVNFNFGADGLVHKGQFLCLAHTSAGSHRLLEMAELDLPCELDRD